MLVALRFGELIDFYAAPGGSIGAWPFQVFWGFSACLARTRYL